SRSTAYTPFGEPNRQVLHSADEIGAQNLRLASEAHVRNPFKELLEDDLQFGSGQICAEAEMRAPTAEGDVLVGGTGDVEREWILEHRFVAVGGDVPDHDLVACGYRLAVHLGVDGRSSAKVIHGGCPPQDLLDGGVKT